MKYILIKILIIIPFITCYSQDTENLKSNCEIFNLISSEGIEILYNKLVIIGKENIFNIQFKTKDVEKKEFLKTILSKKLINYKIIYDEVKCDSCYDVELSDVKMSVKYEKVSNFILSDKKVERIFNFNLNYKIIDKKNKKLLETNTIIKYYNDEVAYDKIQYLEHGGYKFCKGKLPEETFLESALIPSIVILSSAVVIVLFFVIRSK